MIFFLKKGVLTRSEKQEKRSHSARIRQKPRQVTVAVASFLRSERPCAPGRIPVTPLCGSSGLRSGGSVCTLTRPVAALQMTPPAVWPAAHLMDRPPLRYGRTTMVDRGLLPPSLRAGQIAANASHDIRRAGLPVQHGRPRGDGGRYLARLLSKPGGVRLFFLQNLFGQKSPLGQA